MCHRILFCCAPVDSLAGAETARELRAALFGQDEEAEVELAEGTRALELGIRGTRFEAIVVYGPASHFAELVASAENDRGGKPKPVLYLLSQSPRKPPPRVKGVTYIHYSADAVHQILPAALSAL